MVIEKNRVVSIDYKLVDDDGDLIDSSEDGEPLVYLHGNGNIIPGLEKHLEGKKQGDAVNCVIAAVEAYGERDESLVFTVGKDEFEGTDVAVGMQFEAHGEHGVQIVTVMSVEGDEVKVDANHPLAGENLHFDVKVVEVREASAEELEHGHVHGAHGHDHGCDCEGDDCDCDGDGCEDGSCDHHHGH
ncbi:MAG TPA: peptidylprolyl isomerase [Rectinemataceae bacterium]|nr:peptidylprolyl isomerase [Rectinemataceae bacterium]